MKKLNYQDERFNIFIVIILSLFYLIIVPMILAIIDDDESGIAAIIFLVVWILFVTFFIYSYLKDSIKTRKKYKTIKEKGTKYSGYIESFNYDAYIESVSNADTEISSNWRVRKDFTLNISYDIDGSKKTYTTPILGFNPIKDLASRNCNVYIYNNEIYVTDFEKNNDGTYHIWPQDSKEVQDVIEKDKNVKAQYKGLLKLCIIIVILLVIISFVISLLVNLKS